MVLDAVSELATLDLGADASRAVELPVVRDWLEERFGDALSSAGFLSGGMTVAALHPMRVVPHRIIAIAGLDDASFHAPRSSCWPSGGGSVIATVVPTTASSSSTRSSPRGND